jgi:hypothetical protein
MIGFDGTARLPPDPDLSGAICAPGLMSRPVVALPPPHTRTPTTTTTAAPSSRAGLSASSTRASPPGDDTDGDLDMPMRGKLALGKVRARDLLSRALAHSSLARVVFPRAGRDRLSDEARGRVERCRSDGAREQYRQARGRRRAYFCVRSPIDTRSIHSAAHLLAES